MSKCYVMYVKDYLKQRPRVSELNVTKASRMSVTDTRFLSFVMNCMVTMMQNDLYINIYIFAINSFIY